jgi:hypothetical protein
MRRIRERQEARTETIAPTRQRNAINPFAAVAGPDSTQDVGNARGHASAIPYADYGVNNAGPWTAANSAALEFGSVDDGKASFSDVLPQQDLAS